MTMKMINEKNVTVCELNVLRRVFFHVFYITAQPLCHITRTSSAGLASVTKVKISL
jgi:hypothetical protein